MPAAPAPPSQTVLLLGVRSTRPHAPEFQAELDTLDAGAMAAVRTLGLDPLLLAAAEVSAESILAAARAARAVIVLGGEDVDPRFYGGALEYAGGGMHEPEADRRSMELLSTAIAERLPTLAICRGNQLLNVALGGTLVQDMTGHTAPAPVHYVSQAPELADGEDMPIPARVLCTHHQAIDRLAEGLRVIATAEDGTIEAVRHESAPVFGVQFHPEHPEMATQQLTALLAWVLERTPAGSPA